MSVSENRVRECLYDLERYLSDHLPPLLVAESVEVLLQAPARLVAAECQSWANAQFRAHDSAVPISDLLFHAAKKLHILGEMDLVPRSALTETMEVVKSQLVAGCPASERPILAANLERMGSGKTAITDAVDYLIRGQEEEEEQRRRRPVRFLPGRGPRGADTSGDVMREVRRFELLFDRLSRMLEAREGAGGPSTAPAQAGASSSAGPGGASGQKHENGGNGSPDPSFLSELYATAATGAQNDAELQVLLRQLRGAGLQKVGPGDMMRVLAQALPDWVVPEGEDATPPAASAEAMGRLVTLAEDTKETQDRLWELVKSAVEQVNGGSVGRALAILDVAERLLEKEEISKAEIEKIRSGSSQFLDPDRLLELAADPDSHRSLRRILEFFPDLHPESLLHDLSVSESRQERRLALSLLTVHGLAARGDILDHLEEARANPHPEAWQIQRNLIYLLRRIEVPGGEPEERELQLVLDLSTLEHPPPLVREAVGHLGQIGGERAVGALVQRLRQIESVLESKGASPHSDDELRKLLSFVTMALVRTGDASARTEVVRHGFEQKRGVGESGERLAALGTSDLSSTPKLVDRLLGELRSSLPMKIFGLTMHRQTEHAAYLIQALAGTPMPRVREALREVVQRFAGTGLADLARDVLAAQEEGGPAPGPAVAQEVEAADEIAAPAPAPVSRRDGPGLQGDLDLFGLPAILQSLAQARRTGLLEIAEEGGAREAALLLREGRIVECRRRNLQGEAAFYSLVEQPFRGSFTFTGRTVPKSSTEWEIMPLMLEGMRRFDELRRARAVVPDAASLEPTGSPPSSPPDEEGTFVHEVWGRVKRGHPPEEIEEAMPVDPYRVRSLLAHWVEEGALGLSSGGAA